MELSPEEKLERQRQKSRDWRAKNRERHRAAVAQWRIDNPEKWAQQVKLRQATPEAKEKRKVWQRKSYATKAAFLAPEREARRAARQAEREASAAERKARTAHLRAKWQEANPGYNKAWRAAHRDPLKLPRTRRILLCEQCGKGFNHHKRRRFCCYECSAEFVIKTRGPKPVRPIKSKARMAKVARLMKLQKGRCAYCRCRLTPANTHLDHILARALGGTNKMANLQLACDGCNNLKSAKPAEVFARERGLLI